MRHHTKMASIEFYHPFGSNSVKLTRQIQTAIYQASGVPEPSLTLLTGRWSTGLTNNFLLIFAGQPLQDLVLKYYGVRRHFPTSEHTGFQFSYSSLKTHPIVMKSSALLSHLTVEQNVLISFSKNN